jgi:hypothetical protein
MLPTIMHYQKNTGCRAGIVCRALPHGKECFAVRGHDDARHPCTHSKGSEKCTTKKHARQRLRKTHGKVRKHGKNPSKRTTKRRSTAKEALHCRVTNFAVRHNGMHDKASFAVRHDTMHGKGAFAVLRVLCRAQNIIFISFPFYFILFNTYIYFFN